MWNLTRNLKIAAYLYFYAVSVMEFNIYFDRKIKDFFWENMHVRFTGKIKITYYRCN